MKQTFTLLAAAAAITLLVAVYAQNPGPSQVSGRELIQACRQSKDIYSDQALVVLMNAYIQEARTWDKTRLNSEFDLLWQAARTERSELLQAAFYGGATAMFILNPEGTELARRHWTEVLDAIEKSPPRSQIGLAMNLSRAPTREVSSSDLTRMVKLAFAVEPFAGDFLLTIVASVDPALPVLEQAMLKLVDAYVSGDLTGPDGGKIRSYLGGVSREGTGSEAALTIVEKIALAGEIWRSNAIEALRKSESKAPQIVPSMLKRIAAVAAAK